MSLSIPTLMLWIGLLGVAESCSCARRRYNAEVCDDRIKYIIKVRIEEEINTKKDNVKLIEVSVVRKEWLFIVNCILVLLSLHSLCRH